MGGIEELLNATLNDICNREYGIAVFKYKLSIKAKSSLKSLFYSQYKSSCLISSLS